MLVVTAKGWGYEMSPNDDKLTFEMIGRQLCVLLEHDKATIEINVEDIIKIEQKPDKYILQKVKTE